MRALAPAAHTRLRRGVGGWVTKIPTQLCRERGGGEGERLMHMQVTAHQ